MSVSGWVSRPGAELGTDRFVPRPDDMPRLAAELARHRVDGLLMIGGWAGYLAAHTLTTYRDDHAELAIPIVCVPASINNDLPASDLSIGSDSALNSIVTDVDKIKDSAVASHRCFIVEVMGHDCGYLALMAGLATGAEQVYLPEEGISLARLQQDLDVLRRRFENGSRLGLVIRSEHAEQHYTTEFVASLFTRESAACSTCARRSSAMSSREAPLHPSTASKPPASRPPAWSTSSNEPSPTTPGPRSSVCATATSFSRRSPTSPTWSSPTSNATRAPMVDGAPPDPRPHGTRSNGPSFLPRE